MDVGQKKIEVKEEIALGPQNVVFTRIDICDEIQLADLMKVQFTSYFRQAANTAVGASNTNTLHEVCINLAKQRALLHGANVGTIMGFNIGGLTPASGSFDTTVYTSKNEETGEELEKFITTTPIDVVNYAVRNIEPRRLELDLETKFNFLTVAQWGPRKNLKNTIKWLLKNSKMIT